MQNDFTQILVIHLFRYHTSPVTTNSKKVKDILSKTFYLLHEHALFQNKSRELSDTACRNALTYFVHHDTCYLTCLVLYSSSHAAKIIKNSKWDPGHKNFQTSLLYYIFYSEIPNSQLSSNYRQYISFKLKFVHAPVTAGFSTSLTALRCPSSLADCWPEG